MKNEELCNLGVGCEEAGICYASHVGLPERCGRKHPLRSSLSQWVRIIEYHYKLNPMQPSDLAKVLRELKAELAKQQVLDAAAIGREMLGAEPLAKQDKGESVMLQAALQEAEACFLALGADGGKAASHAVNTISYLRGALRTHPQSKQEQGDPVAWIPIIDGVSQRPVTSKAQAEELKALGAVVRPLVFGDTKPQQRKPLSGDEIRKLWVRAGEPAPLVDFTIDVRRTEAAHGIKE